MFPVPTHSVYRAARFGAGGLPVDARPTVPDGRDLHDQRLARDGSRAIPPEDLSLGPNANLPVMPELARLLGLEGNSVDLNQDATPVFSSPTETPPLATTTVNHNIPPSSYRYLAMPVVELLEEVLQRTIGEGPDDPAPIENPGVPPESRRLGDMAFALNLTPGREHDALVLRNAGWALYSFTFDYRTLFAEMRARRPDLQPVMGPWMAGIARAAILRAVQVPLGADGEPQYEPRLYDPIVMPVRLPLGSYISELEWRMGELQRQAFNVRSKQFFSFVLQPIVHAAPRENRVLGAASNEWEGSDVRAFLGGKVVFRCTEAELAKHLQMIPAGTLRKSDAMSPHRPIGSIVNNPPYSVAYPDRASGTTIHYVHWQNAAGVTKPVLVANWQGVHSFSLDAGRSWRPTGGQASGSIDDLRADGWRRLMAERWHEHQRSQLSDWNGTGGR